ncbi:hypothetical protein EYB53_018280 [Candidatus Chloroploca sp. M-50]|uniref:OmpR/PhoB-type domain-containing protein n=1 Tax=Candidatus Chloroploca mongolica TaxID=2528176 RepID=A0ABS4DE12_9CHLR|nr:hypothetical protein [Candidatus Chloroploca mongolica]MBP1467668.1 hypothetical protein [Candidatus Chloroploca mongolica]
MRAALDDPALVQRAPLAELALKPVPNNLPVPPTPLLGRSTELRALRALLMRRALRRADPEANLIVTHRRQGYELVS